MESLNKTLFTSSENELKKIYDEECQKLSKNELILECLINLTIEDLKTDIPENSKGNIKNALLSLRISDYLELDNGQTLLDLENFKLEKINLTNSEQKIIREKVEEKIKNEVKRRDSNVNYGSILQKKIECSQNKFLELERKNRELMLELEQLKREELTLLKEVANIFIGSDQKEIVKGLREDAEIMELRTSKFVDISEQSECNRTKYSHNVLKEISSHLDELIRQKNK